MQIFCEFVKGLDTEISGTVASSVFSLYVAYRFLIALREPERQNFFMKVWSDLLTHYLQSAPGEK